MTTRRNFLTGLTTILAAPAIGRATSIMPVKEFAWPPICIDYEWRHDPMPPLNLPPGTSLTELLIEAMRA